MIIYSVTISLDNGVEGPWLKWMKEVHIPDMMATGYFVEHSIHKLLEPVIEPDQVSYNIWYILDSLEQLDAYRNGPAKALQEDHQAKFGDRYIAIRSVLDKIS